MSSCAPSTRTWRSSGGSTSRQPPSSGRASSASGRRCWGRKRPRSVPARALREDDFVFSSYRENGVAYCRGVDLTDILRVWRGNASSGWDPYTVNMATPQIIIGAQTLHATGYAMGIQNDGADSVAVTYFGDGATSEGDVNEAMVFAASFQAPVVFFCSEQPLGHLGAGAAAVPHPARGPGRRIRHPQPPGGRQ